MTVLVEKYTTIVFDCDGVILNSNQVKTNAFFQAALPYGEGAARTLVDYHTKHGGISRYQKFTLFLEKIVPVYADGIEGPDRDALLTSYAERVKEGLFNCEIAQGLKALRTQTENARWLVVSGGDQAELREVFAGRNLSDFFDGGIFGSPDTKDIILKRELDHRNIQQPALFIGDSKYDFQAASQAGLDFVFVSGWSEVSDWPEWSAQLNLPVVANIQALASLTN